jgi:thiol-disulfide isomerase/thioredoxin
MTQLKKPKVLYFHANWSGPCHAFRIVLKASLEAYKGLYQEMESYDTDQAPEALLRQWRVLGVPTTILISKYDRELGRLTGYNSADHTMNFLRKGVL